jgi:hypothetical protein
LLQAPQLFTSVWVARHVPPQFVFPWAGQGSTQRPAWHAGVDAVQTLPQAPQLFGSVWSGMQAPLQAVSPWGQTHWPLVHDAPVAQT